MDGFVLLSILIGIGILIYVVVGGGMMASEDAGRAACAAYPDPAGCGK